VCDRQRTRHTTNCLKKLVGTAGLEPATLAPKNPDKYSSNITENHNNSILKEISEFSRYTKSPEFADFLKLLVAIWSQLHETERDK